MCTVKGRRRPRAELAEPGVGEARGTGGEGAGREVGGGPESGIVKASGDEHVCQAGDLGDLDGGFSVILEGLEASPFPFLGLSFPNVTWERWPWFHASILRL